MKRKIGFERFGEDPTKVEYAQYPLISSAIEPIFKKICSLYDIYKSKKHNIVIEEYPHIFYITGKLNIFLGRLNPSIVKHLEWGGKHNYKPILKRPTNSNFYEYCLNADMRLQMVCEYFSMYQEPAELSYVHHIFYLDEGSIRISLLSFQGINSNIEYVEYKDEKLVKIITDGTNPETDSVEYLSVENYIYDETRLVSCITNQYCIVEPFDDADSVFHSRHNTIIFNFNENNEIIGYHHRKETLNAYAEKTITLKAPFRIPPQNHAAELYLKAVESGK